jgi:hypothetical protein
MNQRTSATRKKKTFRDSTPSVRKGYRRATYYLTVDLIKRLKIRAAEDDSDASTTVRAALESFLGPSGKR